MASTHHINDWFSIPERVTLGLNFLKSNIDKNHACLPYFYTNFQNATAWSQHDWPDYGDLTGRYVEAFIKARRLLGIESPGEVETEIRKLLMSYFDSGDGLSYRPKPDKPYFSWILQKMYDLHIAEGFDQSRVMWGMLAWYCDTHDADIKKTIQKLNEGLRRVMVIKDDYGFYDRATWSADITVSQNAAPMPHQLYFAGGQIHPLIEIYRHTEIPLALELAERLTKFVVFHSEYFNSDGSWNCYGDGDWASSTDGHVHSRLATLAGIITLGKVTSNNDFVLWAKAAYDWFIETHSSSFGWSPEFLGRFGDDKEGCETCAVMDDINCALALAEAGFTEYYDRVERVTRNQLMESQIINTSLFRNTAEKNDTDQLCFHNIADMVLGGFAGWAGPNDFIGNCANNYCLMNCCGPSGIAALCNVWNAIYSLKKHELFLNIWMNKDDNIVCIKNHEPADGLLEINMKIEIDTLYIRKPSFLNMGSVCVLCNGKLSKCVSTEAYLWVERLHPNDEICIRYDLNRRTEQINVNGRDFDVTWAGDSVVSMNPPGTVMPFYTHNFVEDR